MTVLVTGAAGFIGANLCHKLLEQDYEVVAVDNLITSDDTNLRKLKKHSRFTFIKHDVTQPLPNKLDARRYSLDAIYHLACPTGVPNLTRLAEEMLITCSVGTRNVLELVRLHRAKLLFTSSSEVYGNPLVSPQSEVYTGNVDPTGVRSPYEEGKRFAESLVMMYVRKYKLNAKIVRVFNAYGPGMAQDDSRVIPRFLRQALSGKPLTVHGDGTQKRTFCFIDDLVSGLLMVMEKGKSGEVYNLGSDTQYSIVDVARQVIKIANSSSKITYVTRPPHDHESRLPDLTKVKRLGWKPTTTIRSGLKQTHRWLTSRAAH